MKKLIKKSVGILCLVCMVLFPKHDVFAQTRSSNSQELNFMGIPLGNKYEDCKTKMINKGFRYIREHSYAPNSPQEFNGKFSNRESIIYVYSTPKTNKVYEIRVIYQYMQQYNGYTNEDDYNLVLSSLTEKYGKPTISNNDKSDLEKVYDWYFLYGGRIHLFWASGTLISYCNMNLYEEKLKESNDF